jgi:hypothetical protein
MLEWQHLPVQALFGHGGLIGGTSKWQTIPTLPLMI